MEHDRDNALADLWCARVAALLPEFSTVEADPIARHVPVAPLDKAAKLRRDTLAATLAAMATKPGITGQHAISDDGRAVLASAAGKARQIPGGRIRAMELIVLGTRIGAQSRAARLGMQP